ncbi:MAG TPA: hypothetical protein VF885_25565 [Arthrobacter sp.]
MADSAPALTAEWEDILDRMEQEVSLAFAGETSGWQPPAEPGPIPPELVPQAARVLSAHREAAAMLAASRATTGQHLAAIDSVPGSVRPATARLDRQG